MKAKKENEIPESYLSHSAGTWQGIYQGMPVTGRLADKEVIEKECERKGMKLSATYWDGDTMSFTKAG